MNRPARMIDQQVAGNAKQKALEQTSRKIVPAVAIQSKQRFLNKIFGQKFVTRVSHEKPEQRPLPALNNLCEGVRVTFLKTHHPLIVFGILDRSSNGCPTGHGPQGFLKRVQKA
jgi:hypothetical protein